MNSSYTLRAITLMMICLVLVFTVAARNGVQTKPPQEICKDNAKLCLRNMEAQISLLRAYVRRVKPGDPVQFNPQPDPPGDPDPWYRRALEAYQSLQVEIPNLSQSSPWGRAKWTWSQEKIKAWQNTTGEAQDKLSRLGQSSGRNSASRELNSLSVSVRRLSDSLATPLLRHGRR